MRRGEGDRESKLCTQYAMHSEVERVPVGISEMGLVVVAFSPLPSSSQSVRAGARARFRADGWRELKPWLTREQNSSAIVLIGGEF